MHPARGCRSKSQAPSLLLTLLSSSRKQTPMRIIQYPTIVADRQQFANTSNSWKWWTRPSIMIGLRQASCWQRRLNGTFRKRNIIFVAVEVLALLASHLTGEASGGHFSLLHVGDDGMLFPLAHKPWPMQHQAAVPTPR